MELIGKSALRSPLGSRAGVITMAAVAAVLAGVIVLAGLNAARKDRGAAAPVGVLVANQLIPRGTSAEALVRNRMYRVTQVAEGSLVAGAARDISQVTNQVASQDIYPGQQIATASFSAPASSLTTRLAADERAISVPVDAAHGMVGNVHSGDRVDILAGFNVTSNTGGSRSVVKVLGRNVLVLSAPQADATNTTGQRQITLRVNDATVGQVAFAADNGKIWVVLRPAAGARNSTTDITSLQSMLVGVRPLAPGAGR